MRCKSRHKSPDTCGARAEPMRLTRLVTGRATGEHTHGDGAIFESLMRARSAPVEGAEGTRRAPAASRREGQRRLTCG
eukprot:1458603-Prymnesium_polylepis.2